jgi:hypothetical protein
VRLALTDVPAQSAGEGRATFTGVLSRAARELRLLESTRADADSAALAASLPASAAADFAAL